MRVSPHQSLVVTTSRNLDPVSMPIAFQLATLQQILAHHHIRFRMSLHDEYYSIPCSTVQSLGTPSATVQSPLFPLVVVVVVLD